MGVGPNDVCRPRDRGEVRKGRKGCPGLNQGCGKDTSFLRAPGKEKMERGVFVGELQMLRDE